MDSKKILEKLFSIATKQQKIIEKLAQFAPNSQGDPLAGLDMNEKSKVTLDQEAKARAAAAAAAKAKATPKPAAPKDPNAPIPYGSYDMSHHWDTAPAVRQPTSFTREHPDAIRQPTSMTRGEPGKPMDMNQADDVLPANVVAALDASVPQAKGHLNLRVTGNSVTVKYDLKRIKIGAEQVKSILTQALAPTGLQIVECIGDTELVPNY